jgi:hypothetical protein
MAALLVGAVGILSGTTQQALADKVALILMRIR